MNRFLSSRQLKLINIQDDLSLYDESSFLCMAFRIKKENIEIVFLLVTIISADKTPTQTQYTSCE